MDGASTGPLRIMFCGNGSMCRLVSVEGPRHFRYQDNDTSCTMGYKYLMSVTQEALPLLSFGYY
eukprot:scaffold396314_cov35-Attheya_sp.AAC.1